MSRVEKRIEAEGKKKSYKLFFRSIFLLFMILMMSVCIFEIDKNATLMFGDIKNYNIEVFLTNIGTSIIQSLEDVNVKLSEINNLIPK